MGEKGKRSASSAPRKQLSAQPPALAKAAAPETVSESAARRVSKKEQILTMFKSGITEVTDLAAFTQSRTSYVASVLQEASAAPGYFDLYTSTAQPMNAYSKFFAGKMSYRDVEAAKQSVELIDRLYRQFDLVGDRAGQHHALLMALTMFDRARWTNKTAEAVVFRDWLCQRLKEATTSPA